MTLSRRKQLLALSERYTDEQYALSLNRFRQHPSEASYLVAIGASLHVSWSTAHGL